MNKTHTLIVVFCAVFCRPLLVLFFRFLCSLYYISLFIVLYLFVHCIISLFIVLYLFVHCIISLCSLYYISLFIVLYLFVHCIISLCSLYYISLFIVLYLFVRLTACIYPLLSSYFSCFDISQIKCYYGLV